MTDLTNRSVQEVNELIQKYAPLLEVSNVKTVPDAQIMAIVIDIAIKHIEEKHKNIKKDLKAWSVVALKQNLKKLKTDNDVKKIIDEFIEYYNNEFEKYRATMCDYPLIDLECHFVHTFTHKKNR